VNTIRSTLQPSVVVVLIGWTIVRIPIIFLKASRPDCQSTGCLRAAWQWFVVWVVGCLVFLAIGFLTRKRATVLAYGAGPVRWPPSVRPDLAADPPGRSGWPRLQ
jgi:hypothetical protein